MSGVANQPKADSERSERTAPKPVVIHVLRAGRSGKREVVYNAPR
jgi:hypothetical protein